MLSECRSTSTAREWERQGSVVTGYDVCCLWKFSPVQTLCLKLLTMQIQSKDAIKPINCADV